MFEGREPIYHQIAEAIRGEILSGALEEEDQVMSTTQYATTYRINPATAAKAFAQLVDEEVLYKRRGVGMFVAPGAATRLRSARRSAFFTERLDPVIREADLLGLTTDDLIAHLTAHRPDAPHDAAATAIPPDQPRNQNTKESR
ncbi:GntR family transcriptional regulator [Ornithinimicrobium cryptoxanthini]|uniref:GntR family transcriptional regulator n=1 Tax=Ornithinimicrobium cryptoxanthini TaxID=2934161 RepID=A0ABY4YED0_9MICO|nr:GntR family transcriptional regulator [Ornithinimicrobium cryptoxanthini]USQ75112.1 GntR family transcriptional regulator [Ornithinimicrobium cryptoxanthini]